MTNHPPNSVSGGAEEKKPSPSPVEQSVGSERKNRLKAYCEVNCLSEFADLKAAWKFQDDHYQPQIKALRDELQQKELDRQYHMNCINHLAKENGILGLTSEKTIELTLSRIEDQKQQLESLEKRNEELERKLGYRQGYLKPKPE